jgi:coproporphyrinogen III oxidase-like Fe-S oxidoreductase
MILVLTTIFHISKIVPQLLTISPVISSMTTSLRTHRGALALGLLAFTLIHPTHHLLAEVCQDKDKTASLLKRFDANQNGTIDPEEQATADKARQELFRRLHGKYDADGNGQLSESEKANRRLDLQAMQKEKLTKFDKDGDGRLSREERATAASAKKANPKGTPATKARA